MAAVSGAFCGGGLFTSGVHAVRTDAASRRWGVRFRQWADPIETRAR